MINLSKKTEYGLMALTYLSNLNRGQLANVAEIADSSVIPRELLAKILSELVKAGLAESYSGPSGGFKLARPAHNVSLSEIIKALENRYGFVNCLTPNSSCQRSDACKIKAPMARINRKVENILKETTLNDFRTEHINQI